MMSDNLEICPECGELYSPDIEDQELCEFCEAELHEQYQYTNH
jgi:hypothetical protein